MAERTRVLRFFGKEGLAGGLNLSDNPLIVPPNQMVVANNLSISQSLARRKRGGQELYNTGSFAGTSSYPATGVGNPIRGILQYWRYASDTGEPVEDLFLHQNDKVWSIPNRTDAAVDRTGALTYATDTIPVYQVFEGILYYCVDTVADGYRKWNGAVSNPGDSETANPPADGPGKYLRAHQGRMWMGGNPDFPFRLYYSSFLDGEDWSSIAPSTGGSLDLTYDGDPEGITAIFPPLENRLYVATRRRIYEIVGDSADNFVVQPVTLGIGCISHNSVVATANDVIFASDRGVHNLKKIIVSDQTEIDFLSQDIQKFWVNNLNSELLAQSWAIWDETTNCYILTVVESGQITNTTVLVYNTVFGLWNIWTGIEARTIANVLIGNKQRILFGREDGNITVINDNIRTDLGDGYTTRFVTGKLIPFGDISTQYQYKSITIFATTSRQSTIQVSWFIDYINGTKNGTKTVTLGSNAFFLGTTFELGVSTLGQGTFLPIKISVDDYGYNFQLDIVSGGSSDIEFYGWMLECEPADSHYA